MKIPDWWEALLIALASYRMWRLLAEDDIFDRPRRWLLRLGSDWQKEGDPVPAGYRTKMAEWLTCPWCAGLWISFIWWGMWLWVGDWAAGIAAPFALSAAVGITRRNLDPPE